MIGREGQRLVLRGMRLLRRSHYERTIHHQETRTIVRHVFDLNGEIVIYSGKPLYGIDPNKSVDIVATIKCHDEKWKCTRISRPTIAKETKGELL